MYRREGRGCRAQSIRVETKQRPLADASCNRVGGGLLAASHHNKHTLFCYPFHRNTTVFNSTNARTHTHRAIVVICLNEIYGVKRLFLALFSYANTRIPINRKDVSLPSWSSLKKIISYSVRSYVSCCVHLPV